MYQRAIAAAAFAGTLALALSLPQSVSADAEDFFGNWDNVDNYTNDITHVKIHPENGTIVVHVYGACHPTDCDWGTVQGHLYNGGNGLSAYYNAGFKHTGLRFHVGWNHHMMYEEHVHYTNGAPDRDYSGEFIRVGGWGGGEGWGGGGGGGYGGPGGGYGGPGGGYGGGGGGYGGPGPLGPEDCISFDSGSVTAAYINGSWKVVQDTMWILDYGPNGGAANHAAHIIHHYHFNQQCFIRRPDAQMMYWKVNGHIPETGTGGQDCINVDPMNVTAAHVGGDWKVVDGPNWLLDYGPDKGAAEQAAAVIQTYRLNRQCFIERPNAPMMYWLAQ